MKDKHEKWLKELDSAMYASARGGARLVYVPDPKLMFGSISIQVFKAVDNFSAIDLSKLWDSFYTTVVKGNVLQDATTSFLQVIKEESDEKILPAFKAGMRNINAVMSSHFVIGESLIEATILRKVSQFASELQRELIRYSDSLVKTKVEQYRQVVHYSLEASRILATLQVEQIKTDAVNDENARKWGLDVYDHGARMLAAMSGGGVGGKARVSQAQGTMAGAASGAAIGTAMLPGWGTAAGALIGGVAGAMNS
jgi:hypothetical protein